MIDGASPRRPPYRQAVSLLAMGLLEQSGNSARATSDECSTAGIHDTVWAPSPGSYLTNGAALFRVAHAISDNAKGDLFLELEDCGTLEVVLCPARAVAESGLRSVTPAIPA